MSMHTRTMVLLMLLCSAASAAEDEMLDALTLADQAVSPVDRGKGRRLFSELGIGHANYRNGEGGASAQRLSLDIAYETRLSPELRFSLSDRLDRRWQEYADQKDTNNTLREMFVTWQPGELGMVDLGRVN